MKDWQRCMDGFRSGNSHSKSHLPAINSHTETQECHHQSRETITWSSSEDDDLPTLNTKKVQVVMKLNFEECVSKSSGQIKPQVSRLINSTQQLTTPNTESPIILSPTQPKSPILHVRSNKIRRQQRDFNVSISNDIAPLPESPESPKIYMTPKSPIIICSSRRRVRMRCKEEEETEIILTPTPMSPILSRKRLNLSRSRSPVLGSGRLKKRRRKMLQSFSDALSQSYNEDLNLEAAFVVPSSGCKNTSCFIEENTQVPISSVTQSQQNKIHLSNRDISCIIEESTTQAPLFNLPQACQVKEKRTCLQSICTQENNIEESSQESSANTTVQLIDMPLSQDIASKPILTQVAACNIEVASSQDIDSSSIQTHNQSSQVAENMTASSVEERLCIDVNTSESQSTPYSPNINLDSACKSKARPVKNGLAQRLQRLINRQRSTQRMWRHEKQSTKTSQTAGLQLRVDSLTLQFQRWMALCRVLDPTSESTNQRVFLMLQPELMPKEKPKPGSTISIFPPWQTFEPPGFQVPVVLGVHLLELKRSATAPDSALHHDSEILNFSCECAIDCKELCSSGKPGSEIVRSMFLGEAWASSTLHAVEELIQHPPTLPVPTMSQTLSISEAVTLHSSNPSASLQLLVNVLRLCNYRCASNSVLTSQSSEQHHSLVIARDTHGQLCQLELQYGDCDINEGDTLHFKHLSLTRRHCVERTPGLHSLVASLQDPTPQFMFEFSAKSPPTITTTDNVSWQPPSTSFLADILQGLQSSRVSVMTRVLLATEKVLYVTDNSLVNCEIPYIQINVRSTAYLPPLIAGNIVCLRDLICLADVMSLDQFSCVLMFNQSNKAYTRARHTWLTTLQPLASALCSLKPHLPLLTSNTSVNQLVTLQGTVYGVDEESAFAWPVCAACSSELLQDIPGEGLRCALCTSAGPFPNQVELSVFMTPQPDLHHFHPSINVKLKLLQKTVEQLLPGCHQSNEGYQLDAVLGQQVGPIVGIVQAVEDQICVEEIPPVY